MKMGQYRQGIYSEQGCLLSELVNELTLANQRMGGRNEQERLMVVLEVVDDFVRWSTDQFSKINAKIASDAVKSSSFSKDTIEKLCILVSDSYKTISIVKSFLKSLKPEREYNEEKTLKNKVSERRGGGARSEGTSRCEYHPF